MLHASHGGLQAALFIAFVVGMAFTAEGVNKVKERTRWDSRKYPGVVETLRAFWAHLSNIGNPDLQFVAFSALDTTDAVICSAACTVRAIFLKKPAASTTAAFFKGSDHATVAAANGDIVCAQPAAMKATETCWCYNDGIGMLNGFTVGSHTTLGGNTKSNIADAPTGFVIISA